MSGEKSERWRATREAWDQVGERFAEVGRKVGDRYRGMDDETGTEAGETGRTLSDSVQSVIRQLDQAFTSLGDTLRDAEAQEGLKQAVRTFGDALETTFSSLTKGNRKDDSKS